MMRGRVQAHGAYRPLTDEPRSYIIPAGKGTWGYPLAVGMMVAIDAYLFWHFRKAKWL